MSAQSEFTDALERGDVKESRRIAAILFPHIPQPPTFEAAEAQMHMARTQMPTISFKKRAYSHRWLTERSLPSQLPDELKPSAERLYPVIAEAVFVSANTNSQILKPIMPLVQLAMTDAVEDCYANRDTEPLLVRRRIQEARRSSLKKLAGIITGEK